MGKASRRKRERFQESQTGDSGSGNNQVRHLVSLLQSNRIIVRSCLIFTLSITAFVFIFSRLVESNALFAFMSFTARSAGFMLNLLGSDVHVDGNLVTSDTFSISIVNECTAAMPMIILCCGVFAYPSSFRHKLLGLALGLPGLFVFNLIRVVSLFYIGTFLGDFLDTAHLLIWQPLMILAVIAIWLVWAGKAAYVQRS